MVYENLDSPDEEPNAFGAQAMHGRGNPQVQRVKPRQNANTSAGTGEIDESDEGARMAKIKRPSSSNIRATKRAPNTAMMSDKSKKSYGIGTVPQPGPSVNSF